jgi:hypothetical protein
MQLKIYNPWNYLPPQIEVPIIWKYKFKQWSPNQKLDTTPLEITLLIFQQIKIIW